MACSLISLETPDILEISEVVRNDKPELGRGSYGEVVEVTWKGKVCAGKKLHKSLLGSSSYSVETFKRECNTWSQLQNTHIVEFYGLFYEGGEPLPMIVMEKMDTSLYTYLSIDKQIKVDVSHQSRVDILNQVMRGLAYLHTHDPLVVHRDVTPSNILIDERTMSAKLTDFGVGKMLTRYETQMTKCPGNPAYMPPEVKENGVPVPGYHDRIDIFSLGCVIISVFTRTTPHPLNKDDSEYGKRQACVSLISGDADRFIPTIKRCLQDNPINRPHIRELVG